MIYGSRIEDRGPNAMQTMAKEYINPESLFRSVDHGFSQAVAASGRRTLYVSGQTAWDPSRQLVGGMDLAAQARQAFRNLQIVVEAGGGTLADVVRLRLYIVDYRPEKAAAVGGGLMQSFAGHAKPAATVIGVGYPCDSG